MFTTQWSDDTWLPPLISHSVEWWKSQSFRTLDRPWQQRDCHYKQLKFTWMNGWQSFIIQLNQYIISRRIKTSQGENIYLIILKNRSETNLQLYNVYYITFCTFRGNKRSQLTEYNVQVYYKDIHVSFKLTYS